MRKSYDKNENIQIIIVQNSKKTNIKKSKKEKGVTLVSLGIAVFVILILTSIMLYSIKDNLKLNKLQKMYNDIDNLRDKISEYYLKYGAIPAKIEYTNISHIDSISEVADTGDFYVIDLSSLENLTLNLCNVI